MHARGDMMPKPLNLTDMLWQKNDARAERAQEKGKLARPAAPQPPRTGAGPAEFLPEAPARKAAEKTHKAGPKPFADRVKESQARLTGKDHTFFKHPGFRDAQPSRPETHRAEARPETPRPEAKVADSRDAREIRNTDVTPARSEQAEAAHARVQARKAARSDKSEAPECYTPGESRPIALEAAEAEGSQAGAMGSWEDADLEGGAMDFDALQARLEELGIEITPEQLRDPAFLAEMLWMIDGIPMSLPLFPEAMPVEGEAPAAAAPEAAVPAAPAAPLTADAALAAAPAEEDAAPAAVPAESMDWTAVEEPEREEIAALIREKLGALADKPEFRAGPGFPGGSFAAAPLAPAAAGLQDALQVARGEVRLDVPAPRADVALADPDRLRVLQTAGLTGPQAPETQGLHLDMDLEDADAADAGLDLDPMAPLASADAKDGKGGKQGDSLPDLLGRNAGQAAETSPLRDAAAPKEGGMTAFQSAIEQARASETRLAQAKAPGMPMAQVHEQTVLAQIARKMSALGLRGTEEIRIQLEPEHLGRLRIALEMRDGGLTARISVENDQVRQIVDSNMAGLRANLEDQGIKVQGMEVSVEHKHASLFNPDGSNAREFFRQRGQVGGAGQAEAAQDDSAESDTGRRMGYNTMEYIA